MYQYAKSLFEPVQELAEQFNILQSLASSEKYLTSDTPEIEDEEAKITLKEIEFKKRLVLP